MNNVDQLIEDILGVPEQALAVAQDWLEITRLFADMIEAADDLLIIQTHSKRYTSCHPYLQICYEDDRAMTVEAVSNRFLRPTLSIDAQNTMTEFGWELSEEENMPNYFKFLHKENANPLVVAELFTKTLRQVYGITPSDTIEVRTGQGIWSNQDSEYN